MKNPKEEMLEIPILVTQFFIDNDNYSNGKAIIGSHADASKKALDFLSEAEKLVKKDKANIKKCLAFVDRRFQQVRYAFSELGISLENISEEEIAICRKQRGLKFNYYLLGDF